MRYLRDECGSGTEYVVDCSTVALRFELDAHRFNELVGIG